jgi:hypothetical protein
MGYSTTFWGLVAVDPPLNAAERAYLERFAATRRMTTVHGPYHVARTVAGTDVLDHNTPPDGQPGLWCQWVPTSIDAWRLDVTDNNVSVYDYAVPVIDLDDDTFEGHAEQLDIEHVFTSAMDDHDGGVESVVASLRLLGELHQPAAAERLRAFAADLADTHPRPHAFRTALD